MQNVYTVGQVNSYIKNMFDNDFMLKYISVRGEISNCKYHTSGHIYFSLKDDIGIISCVMFAGNRKGLTFHLEEGHNVIVRGKISVYVKDGSYQMYADNIKLDGIGQLYQRYEALKAELEEIEKLSADCIQGYFYGRPCARRDFLKAFIEKE